MISKQLGKVVAIVEARMSSTRLPGKVLMPARDKPLLGHLVTRLSYSKSISQVVVATTLNNADDLIVQYCENHQIDYYRGSENNVLSRVLQAAEHFKADTIVEITGDCPLIDPDIVDQTIRAYSHNNADYAANSFYSSFPHGMDTQVFSTLALADSSTRTDDPEDLEHVSRYIVNHPDLYRHCYLIAPPSLTWPGLSITLDYEGDYLLIKSLVDALGVDPCFPLSSMLQYLRDNPHIVDLNRHLIRKHPRPFADI